MPGRGLRVLTVNKVPIYVSPFTLVFVVYLAWAFEGFVRERLVRATLAPVSDGRAYGIAAIIAVITMVSIVLHELGHAFVAQRFHLRVLGITIYGFAGLTEFTPEPRNASSGFAVSVSGPLVNLLIGIPAWIWYGSLDPNSTAGIIVWGLAWTNVALGIFNLLPGPPLDGGAAFAAVAWKLTGDRNKAARLAAYSGFVVAALLLLMWLRGARGGSNQIFYLLFAVMIAFSASSALKRSRVVEKLPSLTAREAARRAVTVEANLPLSEALRRAQAENVTAVIVADSSGRPWAVMNGAAADAVPPERRPWTTINQVSRPIEDGMRIPEALGGQELLDRLAGTPAAEYVVYGDGGQPTGVLVMVDVVARIDPAAAARLTPRR